MTLPGASPLPALPATWHRSWKGALPGPVVGKVHSDVGQHHTHQGDVWQVKTLGYHLGSHQHLGFPLQVLAQYPLMGLGGRRCIPVPPQHPDSREEDVQLIYDPLGAQPR